jgi:hypothetical protein
MRYLLASILLSATLWGQTEPSEVAREAGEIYSGLLEDPRDPYLKPDQVVAALNVAPTEVIATIEQDAGYFARRFSAKASRVYVLNPRTRALNYAKLEARPNLQTIQSKDDDPTIGVQSVDTIFVHDSLRNMKGRNLYLLRLSQALRSGGRLVLIDRKRRQSSWFDGSALTQALIRAEFQLAGLRLVQQHTFLPYQYFLVFRVAR